MIMLSRSVCSDYLSGQTERENMIFLFIGTTRKHRISPMTIAMITDRTCHDQVTDQELVAQNLTKHVMVAATDSRLHDFVSAETCLWLCQWHFAELITVKKSHDRVIDHALIAKMYWSHQLFEHHLWLSQLSTWHWHGFCLSPIFLWYWHFAALLMIMPTNGNGCLIQQNQASS